jgi:hypothetical protein
MPSFNQELLARKQRSGHKYQGDDNYQHIETVEIRRPCAMGGAVGGGRDDRWADEPNTDGVRGGRCSEKKYSMQQSFLLFACGSFLSLGFLLLTFPRSQSRGLIT